MLVHLSDGRLAGDHILYGTIFFGAILLAMFLVGARYADRRVEVLPASPADPAGQPGASLLVAVVLAAAVAFASAVLADRARQQSAVAGPGPGQPPEVPGYLRSPERPDWAADVRGASTTWSARYQPAAGGLPVDLFVGFYAPASGTGDVTDARNAPFRPREWRRTGGEDREGYGEALLRRAPAAAAPDDSARIVWWWYATGDEATASRSGAKLRELRALLAGDPPAPAYVALSTGVDGERAEARRALQAFATAWCRTTVVPCPAAAGGATPPD
jgi:EpsI family protein